MTLPTPDPAFHWTAEAWGHALRCKALAALAQHAFTTKQLALRPSTGSGQAADSEAARIAWMQATATVGAGLEQLKRVRQVHGAEVRILKKGEAGPREAADRPSADALISNAPGLVLSVQVADCVPILMADRKTGAVAAVHAGWRGTCARVARAAVAAMAREFGTRPSDLVAAVGPSIGACCYEVGPEVLESFRRGGAASERVGQWFSHGADGSLRLDLWTATRDQLRAAGVREDHISICRLCTQTHRDIFESYRVSGVRAGRMAALIRVPAGSRAANVLQ